GIWPDFDQVISGSWSSSRRRSWGGQRWRRRRTVADEPSDGESDDENDQESPSAGSVCHGLLPSRAGRPGRRGDDRLKRRIPLELLELRLSGDDVTAKTPLDRFAEPADGLFLPRRERGHDRRVHENVRILRVEFERPLDLRRGLGGAARLRERRG